MRRDDIAMMADLIHGSFPMAVRESVTVGVIGDKLHELFFGQKDFHGALLDGLATKQEVANAVVAHVQTWVETMSASEDSMSEWSSEAAVARILEVLTRE